MLAKPPGVGLARRQPRAVNPRLLAGATTDHLAIGDQAHRIGLGVLQADQPDQHVTTGVLGDPCAPRDHVGQQRLSRDDAVTALFKRDAEDLAGFGLQRLVGGIDLEDGVAATTFGLEKVERRGLVAWGDHAIRDFAAQQPRRREIDPIAECDPIAVGAHAVSTASAGVR